MSRRRDLLTSADPVLLGVRLGDGEETPVRPSVHVSRFRPLCMILKVFLFFHRESSTCVAYVTPPWASAGRRRIVCGMG
jgi:hypothetical protein